MKKILLGLLIVVLGLSVAHASLSIGVDPVADQNSLALRYDFEGGIIGKLGLNYVNRDTGGVSSSRTGYGVQVAYELPQKLGTAQPLIGIGYNSNGSATATNTLALILGAEVEVADGVRLSAGITPYSSADTGGVAITNMTTGGVWLAVYCDIM